MNSNSRDTGTSDASRVRHGVTALTKSKGDGDLPVPGCVHPHMGALDAKDGPGLADTDTR